MRTRTCYAWQIPLVGLLLHREHAAATVGCGVGEAVGVSVGDGVGAVGDAVGDFVGDRVGGVGGVGDVVGDLVGDSVGGVGGVGDMLGDRVGDTEGDDVGAKVGAVGDTVGELVVSVASTIAMTAPTRMAMPTNPMTHAIHVAPCETVLCRRYRFILARTASRSILCTLFFIRSMSPLTCSGVRLPPHNLLWEMNGADSPTGSGVDIEGRYEEKDRE